MIIIHMVLDISLYHNNYQQRRILGGIRHYVPEILTKTSGIISDTLGTHSVFFQIINTIILFRPQRKLSGWKLLYLPTLRKACVTFIYLTTWNFHHVLFYRNIQILPFLFFIIWLLTLYYYQYHHHYHHHHCHHHHHLQTDAMIWNERRYLTNYHEPQIITFFSEVFFAVRLTPWCCMKSPMCYLINTLRPRQNGHHIADDIFSFISIYGNCWALIQISPKLVYKDSIIY